MPSWRNPALQSFHRLTVPWLVVKGDHSRSSPQDKNGANIFNRGEWQVGRRKKGVSDQNKRQHRKQNWLWIITCCGEAKLTVLGTSYAICVETPPMSRTPAVLFLNRASCWSLPGTCTSTTASLSGNIERKRMTGSGSANTRHWRRLYCVLVMQYCPKAFSFLTKSTLTCNTDLHRL